MVIIAVYWVCTTAQHWAEQLQTLNNGWGYSYFMSSLNHSSEVGRLLFPIWQMMRGRDDMHSVMWLGSGGARFYLCALHLCAVLKKPVRGGEGSSKRRPGVICRHRLSASHFAELGLWGWTAACPPHCKYLKRKLVVFLFCFLKCQCEFELPTLCQQFRFVSWLKSYLSLSLCIKTDLN